MTDYKTSGLYVDETIVRLVASQVILLTILTLFTQWVVLALFLTIDFAIRAFTKLPSPLAFIGKGISKLANTKPHPIFAPPKRFAAALGFVFSLTISALLYFGFIYVAYITGGILLFCAILESVFKICLGCHVYNWVVLPIQNKLQKTN